MGIEIVNTAAQMKAANLRHYARLVKVEGQILQRLASVNYDKSREIVKETSYWRGTLFSMISTTPLKDLKIQVLSSAPYSYSIEKGVPPIRTGWVSFAEDPTLRDWVETKLMGIEPIKAALFLRIGKAKIGAKGFPYGFPKGTRFMELGLEYAFINSQVIVPEELINLM